MAMTLDELLRRRIAGQQIFEPLARQAGIADWQTEGGVDEGGNPMSTGMPDPMKLGALQDYTFDWRDTGTGNTGTLTAYKPNGERFGVYGQQDSSLGQDLLSFGALAAAGFGGLGALGLGPLGGALGGAGAASTATPVSAAEQIQFLAANGMSDAAIASAMPELAAAGGLTGVGAAAGAGGLLALDQAPFNAAADSQLASSQLGITGAESAAAATAPSSVNLGSLGGTMSTAAPMPLDALRASELSGYSSTPGAAVSPAVTNSGGILGSLPSGITDAAKWLKDNPTLGRLILGGATSLLSATGNDSGGSKSAPVTAVKWNSPIQQGLLSPVQQYAPAAIQQNKPAGLLAQGQANDGAWRYLKG